jgi:hypothetical protein
MTRSLGQLGFFVDPYHLDLPERDGAAHHDRRDDRQIVIDRENQSGNSILKVEESA